METGQADIQEAQQSDAGKLPRAGPVDGVDGSSSHGTAWSSKCTSSPSSSRLQPPSKGQMPGRGRGSCGYKVGCGRGRGSATERPVAPTRKTCAPPTKMAKICDTTSNGQSQEDGPIESVDEDGNTIYVSDGDEDDVKEIEIQPSTRKLTSKVWLEMEKVRINGEWKAKCNWCHKILTAGSRNGTKHLGIHLKICTQKKLKTKGGKTLSQSSLKVSANEDGKVSMESYTFDQEYARAELGNMLVLHDYPLSMVDHVGFRRFVAALQPLFKLHTRNTIRTDIVERYNIERKKAIEYMTMVQSRVAVTTDMWTSDSQKKGYMAITAHSIDESWRLRNILTRIVSFHLGPDTCDVGGGTEELPWRSTNSLLREFS